MIKPVLDARLSMIRNNISRCAAFADIGSDHAYLPICLLTDGVVDKAYVTDIRKGPLANSEKNAKKYGVAERCVFLQGDGIGILKGKKIDILSICGMGAETICAMLEGKKEMIAHAEYMVLQPMSQTETLRKYLHENGYGIFRESIVKDGRIYYQILCASAHKQDVGENFSCGFDYEFPPLLTERKDSVMLDFLRYRFAVEQKICVNMQDSLSERKETVAQKIAYIKERISEYES